MTITKSCGCVFCDMGLPYFVRGKDRYHEAPDGIVECTMEALSTLPIITKEQGLKMRTGKATSKWLMKKRDWIAAFAPSSRL